MSAAAPDIAKDILERTGRLTAEVTRALPGSRKVYEPGSRPDLRVPMREIAQADTPATFGIEKNPPITV
jgi:phosphomethylpyrimidine synthase